MIAGMEFTKYRAVLGDQDDKEFAIVTVMGNGNISWLIVSERAYDDSGCDDLPEELFGQVNDIYGKLQFSHDAPDDAPDDAVE